ncbi:hypothetical protein UFOVP1351_17 [uncultured Caudovirales phage]|uniref:Uncharacterized protein n=1 Tax=uncultured Caudovirales phage TaxID=2100421 RepID=A0A6J5RS41_9CAUD|nr:hypothetical protein UFOVP1351_17 [uncultured Caudovirales phage]
MAIANTTATLDGFFKTVYGEKHIDAVPENLFLVKEVDFRETERIGRKFSVPVILSREHGVTYLASGDGVQTLNDSIAAVSKNVEVDGSQIILRGQIDYEAAAKASSSKAAFQSTTELLVQNLLESASNRLEMMFLYGGSGLGTVSSLASQVITLTTASWAVGIWAGMEGAVIDVYTSGGSVRQAGLTIASVDVDNRALTVTGTTTGIVSTDVIYFKGAKGKECSGLDAIITNTGTMFGIDASAYTLWKAQSYSCGSAALTMAKVLSATAKAVGRGLREDVVCLVNPLTWQNLNANEAALRGYDKSYSSNKSENGFEAITYHGQNGKIEVISHSMVKEGEGFIFPKKRLKRVGAQDLSFKTPGREGEIFLHLPDKNAYELRIYGNQALFCEAPAKCVKLTGIVNT